MKLRNVVFVIILIVGVGITTLLIVERPRPPLHATLVPAYQLLGRTTKTFDRALSKTMPVSDLDEKAYGEAIIPIIHRYEDNANIKPMDYAYLNDLMQQLSPFAKKPFHYRIFIMHREEPNACALPGGEILVTDGLLAIMKSEAELASIIAHEMGHIERSHCYDAVRFQLAARKIGSESLGALADFAVSLMLRHSFSKTQEDEADEYAYELICNTMYDPRAQGEAFKHLIDYKRLNTTYPQDNQPNIIRDYFLTHPPLALRYEKFSGLAQQWWMRHQDEHRYRGIANLQNRICFNKKALDTEWVTANEKSLATLSDNTTMKNPGNDSDLNESGKQQRSISITVSVPGTSDPWLAGMPDGSRASNADTAPDQSPVFVAGIDLIPGIILTFDVSGGVFNTRGCPSSCSPPDGVRFQAHNNRAENGISDVLASMNALVGVFLDDNRPETSSAPPMLDFSRIGFSFTSLSPALKQVFFIGDGRTERGEVQTFIIPAGATRLYLGTMDSWQWSDNSGSYSVKVNLAYGG